MDRLVEAVVAHLCRHGASAAPTHARPYAAQARRGGRSGDGERRGGGEAVYATREGAGQGEAETVNWTGLLTTRPHEAQLRRTAYFPVFFSFFCFYVAPKNGVSILPNAM